MAENTLAQKLIAEALGTGMLVLIGVGSVPATIIIGGSAPFTMAELGMISLAFATAVVASVYAFGHISGSQINPAVTLALAVTGKLPWREVPGYLAAQTLGAMLGAVAIIGVLGRKAVDAGLGIAQYGAGVGAAQAFTAEAIGTFLLAIVVFGAIDGRAPGGFAGTAIGLAVFAIIIPVAPATGAAINPARAFGPMLVGAFAGTDVAWSQLPVYLTAQVAGAVLAGLVYVRVLNRSATTAPVTTTSEEALA